MWFTKILVWLRIERSTYQAKKFDYKHEPLQPVEYWMQQFNTYLSRIPVFGIDTPQGLQASLKLAATAVALSESIAEKVGHLPKPGVSSGTIEVWDR